MPSLVNGLGGLAGFGEGFLQANDDRSSSAIDLTSVFGAGGLRLNGQTYTQVFVNNNGNISFGGPISQADATPMGQPTSPIVIAPFWMDLDGQSPRHPSPGGTSMGTQFVYWDLDAATHTFTVTWDDIGYTRAHNNNPAAFQLQIKGVGGGDFDISFIYETIGPPLADQPAAARAGFSLGATGSYEIAGSGDATAISLVDTNLGNTGEAGRWTWQIRGGLFGGGNTGPGDPDPGDPDPGDPDPGDPDPGDPDPGDPGPGDPGPGGPGPIDPGPGAPPPEPTPLGDVSFSVIFPNGLEHEGNSGVTPLMVNIGRAGDLAGPSVVYWEIQIKDPADLHPGQALEGVIVFGIGQSIASVEIGVVGDRIFEQDDMLTFKLVSASHGLKTFDPESQATTLIVNDDSPTSFAFAGPQIRPEGLAGTAPFEFIVIRSGELSAGSSVHWKLDRGQADALDFAPGQALEGDISFAPGQTQATITIQVAGDTRPELDETFGLQLTAVTNGSVTTPLDTATTGTIVDDDLRKSLLIATPTAQVMSEGASGGTAFSFNLVRTGDVSQSVSTSYTITMPARGGLSADEIQTPLSGTVSFAAGASDALLTVVVNGDTTPEDNEVFQVLLGGGDFNNLVLSGVVLNDDQGAGLSVGAGAPLAIGGIDGEPTSFLQLLVGGGLWGGDGGL